VTAIPRPNYFTAIHRALGLPPQPLDWALIEQAVSSHVREQSDLDWKRERHDAKDDWQDEFAKDAAAMANSGGGLLVLGVNEDRGTAEATGFAHSVTLTDGDERKFRSVIYSRVYPPVSGVTFEQVDGAGRSVVIIRVPSSREAPHLIEKQQLFGAPFRDGTRTEWMHERQLAAAYRVRFAETADLARRLSDLYDEISVATYADLRVCFVAAAVPEIARPPVLRRLQHEEAREIFLAFRPPGMTSRTATPGTARRWGQSTTTDRSAWPGRSEAWFNAALTPSIKWRPGSLKRLSPTSWRSLAAPAARWALTASTRCRPDWHGRVKSRL
jgi:hypothetical protein